MTMAKAMSNEFRHESRATRRMLEQVPEDKLDWKPHDKSMTLARLAGHIAEIPWLATFIVDAEEFDFATLDYKPVVATSREQLLELHDTNAKLFLEAVEGRTDEEMLSHWKLRRGDRVISESRKIGALRGFVLSHAIHHRGQLSVYLRLVDAPVTESYGPTADSKAP